MKVMLVAALLLVVILGALLFSRKNGEVPYTTTTVERGTVQTAVSVSGFVEAKNTARLAFPISGTVTDVFVEEGDTVSKGDLLATLGGTQLLAQRRAALAQLQRAQATKDALLEGPTPTEREVTSTSVAAAKAKLEKTIATEAEKVAAAYEALLSNDLQARTDDVYERSTAPVISGSYTCAKEGVYVIQTYPSSDLSGYSYTLSGLEYDRTSVNTNQPMPLGTCGLSILFAAGDYYNNSQWTVQIPNTLSSTYLTYKNAYDLALKTQEQNVQAARDALALAQKQEAAANALPSSSKLRQAQADIQNAQARIAQIDAQMRDLSIVAPFDGVITAVDTLAGELAGQTPVITLLATDAFQLKARVPEIDITKVQEGQQVQIMFDAQAQNVLQGTVSFISPLATNIDGVAYFETNIQMEEIPTWIRAGMNADIDIIVEETNDTLRIPMRYLIPESDTTYTVQVLEGAQMTTTPVTILQKGSDGYVAISGLNEGTTIVAPQ